MNIEMELECNCGNIILIDTKKNNKFICPKCGAVIFETINQEDEDEK